MKQKITALLTVTCLFVGCATLAPERKGAEAAMGKTLTEASTLFGSSPYPGGSVDAGTGKLAGDILWVWTSHSGHDTYYSAGESHMDFSTGVPTHMESVDVKRVNTACSTTLYFNNKSHLAEYYTVEGQCGLGGSGFGNTGALHAIGIN